MAISVPILFIIFNKKEGTREVFEAIRKQKPAQLFIAADGPRPGKVEEAEKCSHIRQWVLNHIDWPCEVKTLFRDENVGCGRGPSEAITWLFEHVEEGIILEDDCLPNATFFKFCTELLKKYRTEERISAISGNNFQQLHPMNIEGDYYFSIFPSSWGWATWRRAWHGFEFRVNSWDKSNQKDLLNSLFQEDQYRLWWKNQFDWMQENHPQDMWDFQFHYLSMRRMQLAIIPKVNLVSNIGHGKDGTHFVDPNSSIANLPTYDLKFPLTHPTYIKRNYEADVYVQNLLFGRAELTSPYKKVKRYIKKLIRYTPA